MSVKIKLGEPGVLNTQVHQYIIMIIIIVISAEIREELGAT